MLEREHSRKEILQRAGTVVVGLYLTGYGANDGSLQLSSSPKKDIIFQSQSKILRTIIDVPLMIGCLTAIGTAIFFREEAHFQVLEQASKHSLIEPVGVEDPLLPMYNTCCATICL